jgi:DNA-binding NtrC family response regulator
MDRPLPRLLVIDQDPLTPALVSKLFPETEFEVVSIQNAESGLETFTTLRPNIVILESSRPSINRLDLVEQMLAADPAANIILVSEYSSEISAVQAIQKGACDYLTKPIDGERLVSRVMNLLNEAEVRHQTLALDRQMLRACQFEGMISRSPLMFEVFSKIRRAAPHFRTALITGPTGTGKELVARALHRLSPASSGPFVACNCSALVETLAETELFGYAKGAFTGAVQDKSGLFENAHRGTVFLDEVGDLSLSTQAKLLRVLQDHEVRRVGSSISRKLDVRILAATNRNLRSMVQEGGFREDLYYRLSLMEIQLPPLIHRREDLPLLERHFLQRFCAEYKKSISGLTRRAQARMGLYSWPGNIRELQNIIGNATMMTEGKFIDIGDLPERLRRGAADDEGAPDEIFSSLAEVRRRHIMRVLERVGGNKAQAAAILGVGRTTIYHLLSRLRVDAPQSRTAKAARSV